jgi:hypothetical protein
MTALHIKATRRRRAVPKAYGLWTDTSLVPYSRRATCSRGFGNSFHRVGLTVRGRDRGAEGSEHAIHHQENLALLDLPKIHSSARPNTQGLP